MADTQKIDLTLLNLSNKLVQAKKDGDELAKKRDQKQKGKK